MHSKLFRGAQPRPGRPERGPAKRRILLSVDVEAFELRSKVDPVDRLIWGRFTDGDYGLGRIMSIAEARSTPLTMFLDYPEHYAYGDAFLDVGREIVRHGHDLNLHLHLDCIPPGYFAQRGLPEGLNLNTFADEATNALVSDVLSLHSRVTSQFPIALRGGGYRYNDALLRSLRSHGIAASSNYNQAAKLQPYDLGPKRQFTWENGVIELPIATRTGFLNRKYPTHFNFNIGPFMTTDTQAAVDNSRAFLDEFYAEHGDEAVAVFVLHSWSFLRMDAGGEFSSVNSEAPERLDALLRSWSEWAEFVTARDVVGLVERGELTIDGPIAIPSAQTSGAPIPDAPTSHAEAVATATSATVCPICGTSTAKFIDYNGPKRQCPDCGSTERQRVLADLYPRFIKPELDLTGKDVLVAAPASSERRFFKAQGISWRSVDIRPEVKADIVADLCNLSGVADASFDVVIASFVLTCVHDLEACLSELRRVLRPGGYLLTCDPLRFGEATVEHSDLERITSWYGKEAYEKYRVGTFRTFGDVDLVRTLQKHGFLVKTLYGFDAATQSRWIWHMSLKDAPSVPGPWQAPPANGTRRLEQSVAQLELQLRKHRQAITVLEDQLDRAKETLSFRLGYLLIHAPKSWANLRKLPSELRALQREAASRRKARHSPHRAVHAFGPDGGPTRWRRPEQFAEEVFRVYLEQSLQPAVAFLEGQAKNDGERALALMRLAGSLKTTDPPRALELAQRANELEPTPFRAKSLAFLQHTCGEIRRPGQLVRSLPESVSLRPTERDRVMQILGLARLQEQLPQAPRRARPAYEPISDSCLYVTASALPFNVSGYTMRSQALVRAIRGAGFRVSAALRPGYPADRGVLLPSATHEHEGIVYHQSPGPNSRLMPLDEFLDSAAQALEQLGRRTRPQLIHAASNHVNALPALLAARRLGIPFVYEVRGMWELTAATRNLNWEKTERFRLEQQLETFVAREADQVFTLTQGLVDDLADRGVARERIAIIPNCVDPGRFAPCGKDAELLQRLGIHHDTFTLVYAGSLLHYEGLDDVLQALALLAKDGVRAAFVVAGDGEASESLRSLSRELGLESQVHFMGKVEPADIPRLWSLANAAAFPRKPFRVCELVSPLKPLEPMVMGVPVVVSDVAALKEMVRDGETGLVHRAGDAAHLAAKLRTLALDVELRHTLGRAARAATLRDRTWAAAGVRVVERYRALTGQPTEQGPVILQKNVAL